MGEGSWPGGLAWEWLRTATLPYDTLGVRELKGPLASDIKPGMMQTLLPRDSSSESVQGERQCGARVNGWGMKQ